MVLSRISSVGKWSEDTQRRRKMDVHSSLNLVAQMKDFKRIFSSCPRPDFLDHSRCLLTKGCASGGGVRARWRRGGGGEGPGSGNKQRGSGSADAPCPGSGVQGPQAAGASSWMVARGLESL